ncbi:MAG: hypothetical protein K9L66_00185 [Spirochaetaceae bacterium]|nr:hypothetical protein [Spirochaetaceae bacterium]MCF7947163.1 hypothetical protein [Spirochaetia bacterium]MCF7950028.1 hypothetical protein [Spirochaetaceae bacterium]
MIDTGTKGCFVLLYSLILIFGILFVLRGEQVKTGVHMGVPAGIVAHPSGEEIILHSPPLSESEEGEVTAKGEGYIGYFDSNACTIISYEANCLHHGKDKDKEEMIDLLPTRYSVTLYGHGSSPIHYHSPTVLKVEKETLPGSSVVDPHTGKIHAELDIEADVDWSHDSGEYEAAFVLTATESGGICTEEIAYYRSRFEEGRIPVDLVRFATPDNDSYVLDSERASFGGAADETNIKSEIGYRLPERPEDGGE